MGEEEREEDEGEEWRAGGEEEVDLIASLEAELEGGRDEEKEHITKNGKGEKEDLQSRNNGTKVEDMDLEEEEKKDDDEGGNIVGRESKRKRKALSKASKLKSILVVDEEEEEDEDL